MKSGVDRWNRVSDPVHRIICGLFLMIDILTVFPMIFVTIISFSSEKSIASKGYSFFPEEWSLDAYRYMIKSIDYIGHSFLLSCFITVIGTALSLFLISTMAFALSRPEFKYRKICTVMIMIPLFFSGGLAASYAVNTQLYHIKDTLWALILPGACSSWYILVMRTYFRNNIPTEIIESARMDGASIFRIFWQFVMPLSRPITITIGVFTAIGYWNSWYYAMLYISQNRRELFPLQYVLYNMQKTAEFMQVSDGMGGGAVMNTPSEAFRMAMVVIIIIPVLMTYPFFRKFFIKGLTTGAVKE
jgi:putative aldouronate transport system permease protein